MAVKAVHVSDVPNLDQVQELPSLAISSNIFPTGVEIQKSCSRASKFLVIGHRGHGMNNLQSSDQRMKAVKENSLLSFNTAAKFGVDFVEFDVQVTKDDCPVIFHDDKILARLNGDIVERRVTELSLSEFLEYGPQKDSAGTTGKQLVRKTKDGKILEWSVEEDDYLCTLQEAFQQVEPSLGFNIELKFDDNIVYEHDYLINNLQATLQVVSDYAQDRPIIFSTFQPDAAQLVRKLQSTYPVYFLTNGGNEIYYDERRNSLEEAMKLCLENGLQGVVSEVKAIFRSPGVVTMMKESSISLLTYGKLNNVAEAVYIQHLMGVDGVIVDIVEVITVAVSNLITQPSLTEECDEASPESRHANKPQFSQLELSFLLKLIPQLIQL